MQVLFQSIQHIIYMYLDSGNSRIEKFSSNGTYIGNWEITPSIVPERFYPSDIDIDNDGNLYSLQTSNNTIQIDTPEGSFVIPTMVNNTGNEHGNLLSNIAVDNSNNVYVFDSNYHRIQKFTFTTNNTLNFITKWGSSGIGNGQFLNHADISVDYLGNIYVADTGNHRIQKFNNEGKFITKWGREGISRGEFHSPYGIAVDTLGKVYVVDIGKNNIQVFAQTSPKSVLLNSTTISSPARK